MLELKILAVGDPAVYGYVKKEFKIIKNYEKTNNVKIVFDIVEWEYYYDTLIKSLTNYKYDIVMIAGHLWLTDFVNKNYLLELKIDTEESYDFYDILNIIQEEMKLNNKLYMLPSFCDGHILAYRSDKITFKNEQNISIKDIRRNLEHSKDCTTVIKAHPSEIFLDFLPYLRAYNIDAFDVEGKPLFYNEKGIEALNHYKNMLRYSNSNTLNFGNEEVLESIQNDEISLAISWGGQIGQILNDKCINKENIKFIGLKESWNVTWSFAIPSLSSKQDEALNFIKHLSSKEIDRLIGGYCGNPTRKSTFEKDQLKYPWYSSLLRMLNSSKPLPNLPNTGELIGLFTEELVKYMNDEQTAEITLKKIYNKIILDNDIK